MAPPALPALLRPHAGLCKAAGVPAVVDHLDQLTATGTGARGTRLQHPRFAFCPREPAPAQVHACASSICVHRSSARGQLQRSDLESAAAHRRRCFRRLQAALAPAWLPQA